jgi:hypothetical protein
MSSGRGWRWPSTEGVIPRRPLDALAHILLAAVNEAALYIANAPNPSSAKREAVATMEKLLRGVGR